MESIKGALFSKTMWFNGALIALGGIDWIQSHSGIIAAVLPQTTPFIALIGAIGVVLRFVTTAPLAEKVAPAPAPVIERGFDHEPPP